MVIFTDTGRADFDHDRTNLERLGNRLGLRWVWIGNPGEMGQAISYLRGFGCNSIDVMISAHGAPNDFFCPYGRTEGTLFGGGGELSASYMKYLMEKNPDIAFNFVIESCFAQRFYDGLKEPPNLGNVLTSASPHQLSHADEKGSPFINRLIEAWNIIYDKPGNKGHAPGNFGASIPLAFKIKVIGDPGLVPQDPKSFPRRPETEARKPPPKPDPCRISPQPCFVAIEVDGDIGTSPQWGVGIVTIAPAPTDGLPTFGGEGAFAAGSWASQFDNQYGCDNGYDAVGVCHSFSWGQSETITLTAHAVPGGGYSGSASSGSKSPSWGSVFVGWGGDCASAGSSETCTLHLGLQRPVNGDGGQSGFSLTAIAYFAAEPSGVA